MELRVIDIVSMEESKAKLDEALLADAGGAKCVPYVVKWQLAGRRSGDAKTKQMSEVSGTTAKPYKQKGTGRARQGSLRSVQFVGGRTCFGPTPRDFSYSIPKKVVKKALQHVLREKIKEGKVVLLDNTESLELGTGKLSKKLNSINIEKGVFVFSGENANFLKSLKNIKNFKSLNSKALNVYDILNNDFLMLEKNVLEQVKEVLA